MTDEERREAERLAEKLFGQWNDVTGLAMRNSSYHGELVSLMINMYAAACEAKRTPECNMARLERDQLGRRTLTGKKSQGGKTMLTLLDAERARSAKLVEALKMIVNCYDLDAGVGMKFEAGSALNEYEANRD